MTNTGNSHIESMIDAVARLKPHVGIAPVRGFTPQSGSLT
jgi:hypothetical protein